LTFELFDLRALLRLFSLGLFAGGGVGFVVGVWGGGGGGGEVGCYGKSRAFGGRSIGWRIRSLSSSRRDSSGTVRVVGTLVIDQYD
jgi:hypothetical protein